MVERKNSWLPVVALTIAAFVFNSSEAMPIGLMTDIAEGLGVSDSAVGMLVSGYAWVVAFMSLPLMVAFSKMEYRRLMIGIVTLFMLSHVLSAVSTGYWMLMGSRVGVACVHSIFWAIAPPVAVKVAPEGKGPLAMSMIITGTSIAQIVGMPTGRAIGLLLGWRLTFLTIGVIAFLVLMVFLFSFPRIPNDMDFSLRDLPSVLGNRALISIYVTLIIIVTGYFSAYSFIEPFLDRVAGLDKVLVTVALMLFGFSGIIGSAIFSKKYPSRGRALVVSSLVAVPLMLLILRPTAGFIGALVPVLLVWGIANTLFNLVFQAELMRIETRATTIAMALYSGLYNVGIATGSFLGGVINDSVGLPYISLFGAAICFISLLYGVFRMLPLLHLCRRLPL